MARTEGLLGENQRITHAKPFKRGKHSLRIRSVRAGFGPNGGWRWELPCDRDGASTASAITRQPVRAERRIPVDWVEGVARLDDYRPTDVPRHRWHQFVSDCQSFLNSSENWAERAAELGWDARALFGCHRNYPLMHLGSAGLLWAIKGGKLLELSSRAPSPLTCQLSRPPSTSWSSISKPRRRSGSSCHRWCSRAPTR
jgi:hypothetical protein